MRQYAFARGSTLPLTFVVQKVLGFGLAPVPVNVTGYRAILTVRAILVDGTVVSVKPPIVQLDNQLLGGVTIAPQPTTLPNGVSSLGVIYAVIPASVTEALPNPTSTSVAMYYDFVLGDTSSPENVWQAEFGRLLMTPRVMLSTP